MFRISRRLDYGLQLMVALANDPENKPQSTASLAEKLKIPLPFLHQIGHMLMQAGLIKASPGPHGGVRLNKLANDISVLQIVEVLEGPISLHPCPDCDETCNRIDACSAKFTWNDLEETVIRHMADTRLSVLAQSAQSLPIFSIAMRNQSVDQVSI
jgi:Rrf2 family cysteine metabolism transcriptional repressor